MRKISKRLWHGIGTAALLCAASSAQAAAHAYVPFSLLDNSSTHWTGMWLADVGNLGDPPTQLTNQRLDGTVNGNSVNIAVLNAWTINVANHEAINVKAQFAVYGVGGKLYKADLKTIGPVQQFSNGSYGELCTLTALDAQPFAAARSYVQVVVEPVGSINSCTSGVGTQTWLIPASADNTVTPTLEPTNWSVLGAFTDPTDGSFVRWIVWTGNAVAAYNAKFTSSSTLLVGPPTGPAPGLVGRLDGNAILLSSSDNGTTHTDTLYHVSMTGSGLMSNLSFADSSPCTGSSNFSVVGDTANGVILIGDTTSSGYGVFNAPLAGGAVTQIYADSSGSACGVVAGDSASAGHVAVDLTSLLTGNTIAIGVNEAGPVGQTPVTLAGGDTVAGVVIYAINGHLWILQDDFTSGSDVLSTLVEDGNGTVIQNYPNTRIRNDRWAGYFPSGTTPSIERDVVYLFGNPGNCTGGSLTAINSSSFVATAINGLPADACTIGSFGWQPATVGYVREPAGSSPAEIDPVGGQMYILLGPDSTGLFENVSSLAGFPFF